MAGEAGLRRALRRAAEGRSLDVDEAAVLLGARGAALDELAAAAGAVRDAGLAAAGRPGVVTYSRKVFVPLTRLCRDRCHYCTFATVPHRLPAPYLERDEVLAIARAGAAVGAKEALFTLGDRPEARWPAAGEWLAARGYASTLDYLRACAIAVLEETGLLPHLNPGVLSWSELHRLRPVAPSMGMMLETTASRLYTEPGGPHHGSPDKDPAVRLRVLEDAGRVGVPFTTGILVGIGETAAERAESLFAVRAVARRYGHVQEVIIQNFRAKPDTAMRAAPDAGLAALAATVAVARLVLGPRARIQAPPNLVNGAYGLLLRAGIDDWGGVSPVTPDHVNPERPWPAIDVLAARTAAAGFALRERLTLYPEFVAAPDGWLDPRLLPHVRALAAPSGLADPDARPVGLPWQEPEATPTATRAGAGAPPRPAPDPRRPNRPPDPARRSDQDGTPDPDGVPDPDRGRGPGRLRGPGRGLPADVAAGLRLAAEDPARLLLPQYADAALALLHADGPALDALAAAADDVRRDAVGDVVTYVVNRNINFSNICYVGCRFCAFAQRERDADAYRLTVEEVARRAVEARAAGATEVCLQGGIDPKLPVTVYPDMVRAIKAAVPGMHVHAYSPMEIVTAAAKAGVPVRDWLVRLREAGLDTIPGTAAEILDDEVRWVLTKGKLPAATWVEVVTTAHELGLRSTSTMMYGHVDHPRHWLTHFRVLAEIQDATGGFTEFVPLPFVHTQSPIYLAGVARPGATWRESRAVHAMARLLLHGRIRHVQASWVKLGDDATVALLRGGVDDVGGTLMEESISRMAGAAHGSARSAADLRTLAHRAGFTVRQRTTTYGDAEDLDRTFPSREDFSGVTRG
ncbi:FO synthase [Pilimelia terevasa]|uniref:FO synthase n=1 Tax=Pilimelia terevasa TaxID=53372 RepID=A0A8J3BFA3_9ACTN|nr:bifunctional FO biosynthesis protein CofGH [Pilimelia terevasa]GGK15326.1 FO synthase [Pilimelia terevasa]